MSTRGSLITRYFAVCGRGEFPWDMLRYDCAWPAQSEDAARLTQSDIADERRKFRVVILATKSLCSPTKGRWSSFMWTAGDACDSRALAAEQLAGVVGN